MQTPNLMAQAADSLRALALDEQAKERVGRDPELRRYMQRVAARYVAGHTVADVVRHLHAVAARGHAGSAEYVGESCRDEAKANADTEVFLELAAALAHERLACSVSLDLSHVGMLVDPELGYRNARRIASAAAGAGREVMISMEGADRAGLIYATYLRLHAEAGLDNVGITMPARLHRSAQDLPRLMEVPGRIRLVKGAFRESPAIAWDRNSPELAAAYRRLAQTLLAGRHKCSLATHDASLQNDLADFILQQQLPPQQSEFETLFGLGTEGLDALRRRGFQTREYAIFGDEYFLYVLNRIAEEPARLFQAVVDLIGPGTAPASQQGAA
ncbi:proline dehydrogenase [Massilia sp. Root418]|jgi:proline dehydrogenase|uniref:proline dehydrogenase family protein n=1 Tax=Massilia sp. Root418 TaxID=1736532 RepID=UPI0006FB0EF8|nr:proline dehydrogenase family protein [Massilia sp. Root418]KQW87967.1 proline dehydrogenase [Massilia sp. Root418]